MYIQYFNLFWSKECMYHRLPHKYKEFEGMENIVFGKGELVFVGNGWRSISGRIITDRDEALKEAKELDRLYRINTTRLATQRNSHK